MTERAPRIRVQRRPVHGVLLLDKPLGLSSNDALQKAKWLLRAEKAGHTGTLDPLATGVLPLCFGAATKFSQLQLDAPKTYEAVALLGVTTTTGDAEGEVLERREVLPASSRLSAWRRAAAVHRPHPPGAAHAQRAQEGRQGAVRVRARWH
jgi:tRNA pseudouridine55 synthase